MKIDTPWRDTTTPDVAAEAPLMRYLRAHPWERTVYAMTLPELLVPPADGLLCVLKDREFELADEPVLVEQGDVLLWAPGTVH